MLVMSISFIAIAFLLSIFVSYKFGFKKGAVTTHKLYMAYLDNVIKTIEEVKE